MVLLQKTFESLSVDTVHILGNFFSKNVCSIIINGNYVGRHLQKFIRKRPILKI